MRNLLLLALAGFAAGATLARLNPAYGLDQFKKAFDAKYVKKEPQTDEEKALAAAVKKANCNVCHAGTNRKNRNVYGVALNKFLTKTDFKDKAKIESALEKCASEKSDPNDPSSPTFGELMAKGKLPCEDGKTVANK